MTRQRYFFFNVCCRKSLHRNAQAYISCYFLHGVLPFVLHQAGERVYICRREIGETVSGFNIMDIRK